MFPVHPGADAAALHMPAPRSAPQFVFPGLAPSGPTIQDMEAELAAVRTDTEQATERLRIKEAAAYEQHISRLRAELTASRQENIALTAALAVPPPISLAQEMVAAGHPAYAVTRLVAPQPAAPIVAEIQAGVGGARSHVHNGRGMPEPSLAHMVVHDLDKPALMPCTSRLQHVDLSETIPVQPVPEHGVFSPAPMTAECAAEAAERAAIAAPTRNRHAMPKACTQPARGSCKRPLLRSTS